MESGGDRINTGGGFLKKVICWGKQRKLNYIVEEANEDKSQYMFIFEFSLQCFAVVYMPPGGITFWKETYSLLVKFAARFCCMNCF